MTYREHKDPQARRRAGFHLNGFAGDCVLLLPGFNGGFIGVMFPGDTTTTIPSLLLLLLLILNEMVSWLQRHWWPSWVGGFYICPEGGVKFWSSSRAGWLWFYFIYLKYVVDRIFGLVPIYFAPCLICRLIVDMEWWRDMGTMQSTACRGERTLLVQTAELIIRLRL